MVKEVTQTKKVATKDPVALRNTEIKKQATIDLMLKSPIGLRKLAAVLTNPVRKHLDHVPIGRKLVVTEPIPEGQIAYFDADILEFSAVKISEDGTSRMIVCDALRTQVDPFEIVVKPKVPFKELRIRKYKVFDRMKERLKQGLGIREDYLWFSLFHDAAEVTNTPVEVGTDITKDAFALAYQQVDRHRLATTSVIISPEAVSGIRRWVRDTIDEVGRIEIRRTGYLGNLFGANFYVTNLITADENNICYAYVLAAPEFLAWNPVYADAEVVPADRPDDYLLGLNGYELMGMVVHNTWAVCRIKFVHGAGFGD